MNKFHDKYLAAPDRHSVVDLTILAVLGLCHVACGLYLIVLSPDVAATEGATATHAYPRLLWWALVGAGAAWFVLPILAWTILKPLPRMITLLLVIAAWCSGFSGFVLAMQSAAS